MEDVKEWINYGSNRGYGFGCGSACGSGSDSYLGFGYDMFCGFNESTGHGDGEGSGYGFNCGDGNGDGFGLGSGHSDGNGPCYCTNEQNNISMIDGFPVYLIDGVPTIIRYTRGNVANGYIVGDDLTLIQCYIAKGRGYFAHGETLRVAVDSLRKKILRNISTEETIEAFLKHFRKFTKYPGMEFFEWHSYLTGSCLMGRQKFVKNHGLDLDAPYTVEEFIACCENDYGGEIIKQLKKRWEKYE